MSIFFIIATMILILWNERKTKKKERELEEKRQDAMNRLIKTQGGFKIFLDRLEGYHPDVFDDVNGKWYRDTYIETDNDWFI